MIITVNNILKPNRHAPNPVLLEGSPNFARSKRGHLHAMIGASEPPAETNAPHSTGPEPASVRRLAVADLLQGARELILVHHGAEYRLRITGNGKLILTK
jgi:hemin uptake protein HemP